MRDKVKKIMAEIFICSFEEINEETNMNSLSNWDSLQHLVFVSNLEEVFEVEFSPEEIAEMTSFIKIIDILTSHDIN